MNVHFSGQGFDYQTLRTLSYTTFGGAEPGEVFVTVERIEDGDTEAWHTEWRTTAERVDRAAAAGNERTARAASFRAHNYYRCAEFFLASDDPRRRPTYAKSREAFRRAVERLDTPVEPLEIPYEGTTLPGYCFLPPEAHEGTEPFPTVVCLGGLDSLGEELYFLCGIPEALDRGYAVVLFDGPGQGAPLRDEGLTARPDWEHVVGPVLDALSERERIDSEGVGLVGVSMGGYYAPRAAAFEERVAACVAFDHMHDPLLAAAGEHPRLAPLVARAPVALVNALAALGARFDPEARAMLDTVTWVFGVDSAASFQRALSSYSLSGIAGEIDCPMLVLAGEDDHFVPLSLAQAFLDELTCPTTLRVFTTEEGAGEHCQVGNLRLATGVIYDWFDESLPTVGRPGPVDRSLRGRSSDRSVLEQAFSRPARPSTRMSALADQECVACTSEDDPLTGEELEEYYEQIDTDVWEVVDEHHLEGTYEFEDFRDALEFTKEVGELAEEEWHHPDLHLSWGEVVVEMWTHKIDGLHKSDFVMAARMDRIHEEYAPEEDG